MKTNLYFLFAVMVGLASPLSPVFADEPSLSNYPTMVPGAQIDTSGLANSPAPLANAAPPLANSPAALANLRASSGGFQFGVPNLNAPIGLSPAPVPFSSPSPRR